MLLMLSPPTDAQKISLVDSRRGVLVHEGKRLYPAPAGDDDTSTISTHLRKSRKTRPRPLLRRRSHIETVSKPVN